MKVGIDDLNVAAGRHCLDFKLLVESGRRSANELAVAGFRRRSVLQPWEDPITLGAEAARPLINDPDAIGLLLVATETGLDYGKPISTYIHRVLSLNEHCRNAEIKHACYGATMALRLACGWVRESVGRKALVIGTDLCRRQHGPAELTAGVGAVAMIVSAEPRVLEVEPISGCAASELWDVARPTRQEEHSDGTLSLSSYLDMIEVAWHDLQASSGDRIEDFQYILYHSPLISLVREAHLALTGSMVDFRDRVEPGLEINRDLANIYGGSLYASIVSLLEGREVVEGSRILFFSYGSGACAEMWTGRIARDAARVQRHHVSENIAARKACTVEEWLAADEAIERQMGASELNLEPSPGWRGLVLTQIKGWHRRYQWV